MKIFDRNFPPERWVILPKDKASAKNLKKVARAQSKTDGVDYRGWAVSGSLVGLFNVTVGYSLAASLAASGPVDGIYIFPESEDGVYRLIVIDGQLLSVDSGFTGDADGIAIEIDQIQSISDLPIFFTDPSLLGRFEDGAFVSVEELVDESKLVEIQTATASSSIGINVAAIVVAVGVIGGMGYAAKKMFFPTSTGMSQAEQQAKIRQEFLAAQSKQLAQFLMRKDDWVAVAVRTIRYYSVGGYGWAADGGVCQPVGDCTMNWHKVGGMAFIEPLASDLHLIKPSLNVSRQSLSSVVTFPVNQGASSGSSLLHEPNKLDTRDEWARIWWGFQQRQNLRNPGVILSTPSAGHPLVPNPPLNVPVAYLGSIDIGGQGAASLDYVIDSLKVLKAHVDSLSYAPDMSDGKNNWKIEVSYVSR